MKANGETYNLLAIYHLHCTFTNNTDFSNLTAH